MMKTCDYLIVGGGATGMAFADSLLRNSTAASSSSSASSSQSSSPSVIMIDQHDVPGGQWNDSYDFVQLHQPSSSYGVESMMLEPTKGDQEHRATREEILTYYTKVSQELSQRYDYEFIGRATLDMNSASKTATKVAKLSPSTSPSSSAAEAAKGKILTYEYTVTQAGDCEEGGKVEQRHSIQVRKRLVDARWMQPDLPISIPPKFDFDATKIKCVPINSLVTTTTATTTGSSEEVSASENYVVIGAGKTGMDGVYYLLTKLNIDPNNIVWVMPHDPWITARENIGNCMEFLHDTATKHPTTLDIQQTFVSWEKEGKVYRLCEPNILPTKFKDATLSKSELETLKRIPDSNVVRRKGRVSEIRDDGRLVMDTGTIIDLPFSDPSPSKTTYVHCSAGAFNYTKQIGEDTIPVFDDHRITIQDVYGTPGFCFVGSIIGRLESIPSLSDHERNQATLAPSPTVAPTSKLGFTSGDVGSLTKDHGYIQRLKNLKQWLTIPDVRDWLVGHRLFNLGHRKSSDDIARLVEETWNVLKQKGLVE